MVRVTARLHEIARFRDPCFWVEDEQPCCYCRQPTHWIDLEFQAFLCAFDCARALWREYVEAERRLGPWHP